MQWQGLPADHSQGPQDQAVLHELPQVRKGTKVTMITITLSEEEQDFILGIAGHGTPEQLIIPRTAESIAKKILRTRAAEEAFQEAYEQPDTTACGLCSAPRNSHDADDHHWQWNLAPVREAYVTRTGKVLTDADLKRYADEAEAGYDLPGEPAG